LRSDLYYVPVDESDPSAPVFNAEDDAFVQREVSEGSLVLFERPLQAKGEHWVMQFTINGDPEVIAPDEAKKKLSQTSREALKQAAYHLRRGNRDLAEERVAYAWRSTSEDPLPLLAFIALLRPSAAPVRIAALEEDLAGYSAADIEHSLNKAHEELDPVVRLIRADLARAVARQEEECERPKETARRHSFLDGFTAKIDFFSATRRSIAFAGGSS
jgi:hypothetical protein